MSSFTEFSEEINEYKLEKNNVKAAWLQLFRFPSPRGIPLIPLSGIKSRSLVKDSEGFYLSASVNKRLAKAEIYIDRSKAHRKVRATTKTKVFLEEISYFLENGGDTFSKSGAPLQGSGLVYEVMSLGETDLHPRIQLNDASITSHYTRSLSQLVTEADSGRLMKRMCESIQSSNLKTIKRIGQE